ncbi:hypothetical protein Sbal195_2516 [Shewanella baltica OS195]|uniref:Uncharacterized protein n=1 Tax=Shewanella baltica (strain OS195) TaxID=399599 RepID=A9L494_SHEB9|nr:hypothetical protein Sbal195_2516 [Shewanella baltica OS195]ADT94670.1 hypothetical protein Sbal678_2518 [Shewanella baltica OS678]
MTVGGMDAAVEPSGTSLWRVTGEPMTMNTAQLEIKLTLGITAKAVFLLR